MSKLNVSSTQSHNCYFIFTGGYICIVSRMENFKIVSEYKDSFFPLCYKLESEGKWRKVDCSTCAYLPNIEGVKIIYQVCDYTI